MSKRTSNKPRRKSEKQIRNERISNHIAKLINNDDVQIFWAKERKYANQIIEKTSDNFFLSLEPPVNFRISTLYYFIKHLPMLEKKYRIEQFDQKKPELPEYSDTNYLDDHEEYILKPRTEKEFLDYDETEEE